MVGDHRILPSGISSYSAANISIDSDRHSYLDFCSLGYLVVYVARSHPGFMLLIVPERLISQVGDKHQLWMGSIVGMKSLVSSSIMINNVSVSFRALERGIIPRIYTSYLMIFNNLLVGAIGTLLGQNNLAYLCWVFVFPHSSFELPAIFFAGGSGLLIAKGILFPGWYLGLCVC
jgi:uncharacterized membrane protein SpoIIM required for sporulation